MEGWSTWEGWSGVAELVGVLAALLAFIAICSLVAAKCAWQHSIDDAWVPMWTSATRCSLLLALALSFSSFLAPVVYVVLFPGRLGAFLVAAHVMRAVSFATLFYKMLRTGSAVGISLNTLDLYAFVFATRYLDLLRRWEPGNMYDSAQKVLLFSQAMIAALVIRCGWPQRQTFSALDETVPAAALLVPAAAVATISAGSGDDWIELGWRFSVALEAVAIVPQLTMLRRRGGCDPLASHFIFALGAYKLLEIISWVQPVLAMGRPYGRPYQWICGVVQVALFARFFVRYAHAKLRARRLDAPLSLTQGWDGELDELRPLRGAPPPTGPAASRSFPEATGGAAVVGNPASPKDSCSRRSSSSSSSAS